ncbi:signal recognition particle-docking protein FtsY [Yokenella regensburgei]|uniref:Signal recognition particle receptor FtsY n=1 Tax=Yokenella regensburgei TaxID=158877 RepID=A0AB38FZW4_9ENTR|nr:signal recognition particle-docking protein FtsY [Yokenella regensburgei]KFD24649.1 signal recognition particle receptor protein [Yokenella regensburgei ATCC 49455]SQA64389.1 Cell division protein FtsY [Yokenella regensburgei]SQB01988.1 Cell division protein FtsY [Yokenella regensburgei]SUQ03377.1 Cell division protein FtsY [Yokenella regensburgei]
MAKEKKRGLFSWLGFGQKEQAPEPEAEQQVNEQPVAAEEHKEEAPAEAVAETVVEPVVEPEAEAPAHSKAEIDAFAEEIVDVTEEVIEHEKPQPVEAPVVETAAVEKTVVEEAIVEEAAVEVVAQPEPEVPEEPEISDEELEAQALAAVETPEEAVIAEAEEEPVPEEEVEPEAEAAPQQEQEKPTKEGFFARLKRSLVKTKENLGSGFISLFRGKKIDDDLFEELEEQLLIADVGVDTTRKIIANLTEGASRKQLRDAEALYGLLKEEMGEILAKVDEPLNIEGKTPFVILMVGVNGVGKTTTIGKLARQFEQQGKSVMLAAGDTFRAAAVEQLQVWGQRNNIPVVAQHTGADSASVIFDAIQAAKARNIDVLIADTAGRLQNKSHLMEELKKIVRVMKKLDVDAPHEVMLTIDASTGQNAISQAKLFDEAVGLTGITLTKLDGTAKGGVIFSVADQFNIPIRYIGVGERIEDLRPFNAGDFIEALFARED